MARTVTVLGGDPQRAQAADVASHLPGAFLSPCFKFLVCNILAAWHRYDAMRVNDAPVPWVIEDANLVRDWYLEQRGFFHMVLPISQDLKVAVGVSRPTRP